MNPQAVFADIQSIRKKAPLIHNITNYVVMEHTANVLLAIGASPVMAHAHEEVEAMASLANGLVLNIGTLSGNWISAMQMALQAAKGPVVLDPVGAGATPYRTETALKLLRQGGITAIRGNASEIVSLIEKASTKGVDSRLDSADYVEQAKQVALRYTCLVWMSGRTDLITDGHTLIQIHNGHPLMSQVIGMGCGATAVTAAFLAVNPTLLGCAHAAALMGIAGEVAAKPGVGPGAYKPAFLDALHKISLQDIQERLQCST